MQGNHCPIKYNTTDNMIPEISSSHDHLVRLRDGGGIPEYSCPTKGILLGSLKFIPVEIMVSLLDRKITEKKIYFEFAYYAN